MDNKLKTSFVRAELEKGGNIFISPGQYHPKIMLSYGRCKFHKVSSEQFQRIQKHYGNKLKCVDHGRVMTWSL